MGLAELDELVEAVGTGDGVEPPDERLGRWWWSGLAQEAGGWPAADEEVVVPCACVSEGSGGAATR